MPLFWTEFVSLRCSDPETVKRWWISSFDCKECPVPADWDDPLCSDIALRLPGNDQAAILIRNRRDEPAWAVGGADERALIFCSNVKKARAFLQERGAQPGPVQAGGGAEFFEVADAESHVIEISTEP